MPIESGAFWSAYWAMMLFALGGSMWAELGALIAASVIVLVALVIVRTIFPKSGELLTLILTSATAIILFLQFQTLDKTDRTLRETLKANQFAQRAFVVADEVAIVPVGPVEGGLPNNWTVSAILENGGTTATRNMTFFPGIARFNKEQISKASGSGASPPLTLVLLRSTERTPPNIRPLALAARTSAPAAFAGHHQAASAPLGFLETPNRPSRHRAMQVRSKART